MQKAVDAFARERRDRRGELRMLHCQVVGSGDRIDRGTNDRVINGFVHPLTEEIYVQIAPAQTFYVFFTGTDRCYFRPGMSCQLFSACSHNRAHKMATSAASIVNIVLTCNRCIDQRFKFALVKIQVWYVLHHQDDDEPLLRVNPPNCASKPTPAVISRRPGQNGDALCQPDTESQPKPISRSRQV